jgi:hypothetical protein
MKSSMPLFASRNSATYDRAVELERIGGEVLDLPAPAFSHN